MAETVEVNIKANTQQAQSALSALNKSWIGLNAGLQLAQTAARTLGEAYDALVGDTVAYANTVRQMMRISGQNAEQTSRMIQLTDDFNVSQEALTTAMRGAATKGVAFTTEALAGLADEYLKLAPGVERNTFLLDNFGRAGLEMAKVMEVGGDAIRAQSAAIADNLVLTDEQVAKARELEIAQDNLTDAVEGLKTEIGNALIPVLVDAANAVNLMMTKSQQLTQVLRQHEDEVANTSNSYQEYQDEMIRAAEVAGYHTKIVDGQVQVYKHLVGGQWEVVDGFRVMTEQEYLTADAAAESDRALQGMANSLESVEQNAPGAASGIDATGLAANNAIFPMDEMARATQGYDDAIRSAADAQAAWSEKLGGDMQNALEGAGLEGEKLNTALGLVDEAMGTMLLPTQQLKDEQIKLAQAYADGKVTEDEFKAKLAELKTGYEEIFQPIVDARVAVEEWEAALKRVTDHVWTVVIQQSGGAVVPTPGEGPTPPKVQNNPVIPDDIEQQFGLASGGSFTVPPGYPNDSFMLGVQSGERVTVTPANQTTNYGGITVVLPNVTNAQQLLTQLGKLTRNAVSAGRSIQGA